MPYTGMPYIARVGNALHSWCRRMLLAADARKKMNCMNSNGKPPLHFSLKKTCPSEICLENTEVAEHPISLYRKLILSPHSTNPLIAEAICHIKTLSLSSQPNPSLFREPLSLSSRSPIHLSLYTKQQFLSHTQKPSLSSCNNPLPLSISLPHPENAFLSQ
ncbi:hypothetical protein AMTRI_Chr03g50430 [Amborella trichopoda]